MNISKLVSCLIISLLSVQAENKTLGDWANFHREADNLCRNNQHEEAVKVYEQVIQGRLPFQGKQAPRCRSGLE
jgi:pentatricopeptide repeat protein